ncbi:beta-1,6-N-acetylglucosaminyltransferase [Bosea sp. (in: a-proteobacteria)]|uniref:beta-1,6-N-acetylglucosaminyltransferase n=1 Tax=Bosea sp. (in: a-proteobacteria) TaxID=1871050 RepID=UPI002FCC58C4
MIAYFILVHRYPEQFKRLFRSIYSPANHYLVHVDKSSGSELDADIRGFLADFPNSEVLQGRNAVWGGYSLVEAELRGMVQLLRMNGDWEFFINLSGQDYPLKSQNYIARFLTRHRGKEFIKVLDQRKVRPETMSRVKRYVVEFSNRIVKTWLPRPFLAGASPYIGNQWMIVSRRFCEFVCHDPRSDRYKSFYKNTFIADEGFFQTVMMNTPSHGEIISDDLRMIDWVPDGDIKLRPRTFTAEDGPELIASRCLFARKFDATIDEDILDLIDVDLSRCDREPAIVRDRSFVSPLPIDPAPVGEGVIALA